ncbi:MAG: membrane-bound lytic murein transglycosylase MltF [Gammaproteobacteria bacterium]|nr:MAG: membrane-bound lytic murein transglycosylase MltF [Gammaproteobacteria bacterium]
MMFRGTTVYEGLRIIMMNCHRFALGILVILLTGCSEDTSILQEIKNRNELVVLTRNSPTTYYQGPFGPAGFEFDLASLFADHLGVKLKIELAETFPEIIPRVNRGEVHLAAAGLTVTPERKQLVRFASAYQNIAPELIYRKESGKKRPRKITDTYDGDLEVVAGSSHAEKLRELKNTYAKLTWKEHENIESDELLYLVWSNLIDYTIADSNEFKLNRRFYPELASAFAIDKPQPIAWAFPKGIDDSLFNEANSFFRTIKDNGTLRQLINRYYGHVEKFSYVGTSKYLEHINKRLPKYQEYFEKAGEKNGVDWRLLAAIGYQESHWDESAVSPTGVRGIMMLTQDTAKYLGIKNRRDIEQSIMGGAGYFRQLWGRIPDRIKEPDRTWMALAAYNIGLGHLEDARIITEKRGGDPDKWVDVRDNLPLLSNKKWYTKTKYGYARGREPVIYVQNIRNYYDLMIWHLEGDAPTYEDPKALNISSPVL